MAVALAAVVVGVAVGGVALLGRGGAPPPASVCTVAASAGRFTLDVAQAANAATIAAIGRRLGLPDHAVTVALATSLQESNLRNLAGGDRDSVGLFQQRPSEGWGPRADLLDPVYATTAFYRALGRVSGWETLTVAEAAQSVQHSAAPDAYAAQEPEGRSLAVALTGEDAAAFACHYQPRAVAVDPSWSRALAADLGRPAPGQAVSAATGWTMASWLVAHGARFGFHAVSFAGLTWKPSSGTWRHGGPADGTVHVS